MDSSDTKHFAYFCSAVAFSTKATGSSFPLTVVAPGKHISTPRRDHKAGGLTKLTEPFTCEQQQKPQQKRTLRNA